MTTEVKDPRIFFVAAGRNPGKIVDINALFEKSGRLGVYVYRMQFFSN